MREDRDIRSMMDELEAGKARGPPSGFHFAKMQSTTIVWGVKPNKMGKDKDWPMPKEIPKGKTDGEDKPTEIKKADPKEPVDAGKDTGVKMKSPLVGEGNLTKSTGEIPSFRDVMAFKKAGGTAMMYYDEAPYVPHYRNPDHGNMEIYESYNPAYEEEGDRNGKGPFKSPIYDGIMSYYGNSPEFKENVERYANNLHQDLEREKEGLTTHNNPEYFVDRMDFYNNRLAEDKKKNEKWQNEQNAKAKEKADKQIARKEKKKKTNSE